MWYHDKKGFSLARIKRWLRIMDDSLSRDLEDIVMTDRPLPVWEGETLARISTSACSIGRRGRAGKGAPRTNGAWAAQ